MPKSPLPRIREDKVLRLLVEGTASQTGTEFFRALVRNLSEALQCQGAWITEYFPTTRRLRAIAFWMRDEFLTDFEHHVDGTPCQAVVDGKLRAHFPERLIELFPDDRELDGLGMVSYLGTPLLDADGKLLGHLAVMDDRPMLAEPQLYELLDLFAARAIAEMRRIKAEEAMREREAQLSLLLDTAMDAILVLDVGYRIARINPRAAELFGCASEDLEGEVFIEFLSATAAKDFGKLAQDLATSGRPLWLPGGIEAIRWDKTPFPAEAAISRYTFKGAPYFTVFLRSVNERVEAERRIRALVEETRYLREEMGEFPGEMGIVGRSASIRGVCHVIKQVAPTDATVLIFGETGTGKELVARAIHEASARKDGPLVRVNCAAIPEALIESEFFGHEKGAFTGATTRREGRFAQAHQGTLFLDEVGELPLELQAKLLRVLQEGEYEPIGGDRTCKVDVRVVAATNRNLEKESEAGRFREDLFYRLNVFPIWLPPLRERGDDLLLMAETFATRFAPRMSCRFDGFDEEARRLLKSYEWPGNVRELQNVIERALILSANSKFDLARALPQGAEPEIPDKPVENKRVLSAEELEQLEKRNLERALEVASWKISGAGGVASLLGLPASTVSSRIKALGIVRKHEKS